ncbi:MAG: tRNA 4-thiouridine(8) synthase ThiI [Ruminococcaceae bacterium]|nr:tRNA 4-thiouridine(8) synthase ThiI [Oscillospiraceae bacterium]
MKEIILIKNGELVLKGLNRSTFESMLIKTIRRRLKDLGKISIKNAQSTIYIEPVEDEFDFEEAIDRVSKIFGIAAFSRCAALNKDMDEILSVVADYVKPALSKVKTFKVIAKRSDKSFPFTSPEISAQVGGAILSAMPYLKVDVKNPDIVVSVEIRDYAAYIHAGQIHGAGGLPVGSSGKATILISGGIDSPVAAYLMAKRGLTLNAVHFASPPYTGPLAEKKVKTLLEKVAAYSGDIRLALVPFTEIQEAIAENCKEEYFTLIMRRMMMRISEKLAVASGSKALITGESLGQVASQTLPAIGVTDIVTKELPVLRPLIGMDKEDIIIISRKIDAFETSILPYEDCCTVFTPKHPRTRPTIEDCQEAESVFDFEPLIEKAINETLYTRITRDGEAV